MQDHDRDASRGNPDTRTNDRADTMLPVTAEVGSEGGSYADPTHQVATFGKPLDELEEAGGAESIATQAIRGAEVTPDSLRTGPDPADGLVRYPTEDPASPARPRQP
jgi:hypothetical protein